jgi:carbonic anhydrase
LRWIEHQQRHRHLWESHTNCVAVKGAIDNVQLGNLTGLLEMIRPAVDAMKDFPGEHSSKNLAYVDAVATKNVQLTVERTRKISPILAKMEHDKQIMIVRCTTFRTGRLISWGEFSVEQFRGRVQPCASK